MSNDSLDIDDCYQEISDDTPYDDFHELFDAALANAKKLNNPVRIMFSEQGDLDKLLCTIYPDATLRPNAELPLYYKGLARELSAILAETKKFEVMMADGEVEQWWDDLLNEKC